MEKWSYGVFEINGIELAGFMFVVFVFGFIIVNALNIPQKFNASFDCNKLSADIAKINEELREIDFSINLSLKEKEELGKCLDAAVVSLKNPQ